MDKIEPVAAYMHECDGEKWLAFEEEGPDSFSEEIKTTPLYAHPAQHDAGAVERVAPVIEQVMVGIQGRGEHLMGLPELVRLIRGGARITSIRLKGPNNE